MDFKDCINILSNRHDCCEGSKFALPPRTRTDPNVNATTTAASENSNSIAEVLKGYEDVLLLKLFISLQMERVQEYTNFSAAMEELLTSDRIAEYPDLVLEMTSRFSAISQHIILVKVEFQTRNRPQHVKQIERVQQLEKQKLMLVASLHLDSVQRSKPGLIQAGTEGFSLFVADDNSKYSRDKIQALEAQVAESLEDIQIDINELISSS